MQQFTDKDNNPIDQEKWQWIVVYDDNTELRQFDYTSITYHYFSEIDQERAVFFGVGNPTTGKAVLKPIPKGAKLIHFYDNIIQQPMGGSAIHHRLYCFGYELGKEKHIWSILPTDIVVEGKIDNVEIV